MDSTEFHYLLLPVSQSSVDGVTGSCNLLWMREREGGREGERERRDGVLCVSKLCVCVKER